jgi:hypothetical protein
MAACNSLAALNLALDTKLARQEFLKISERVYKPHWNLERGN